MKNLAFLTIKLVIFLNSQSFAAYFNNEELNNGYSFRYFRKTRNKDGSFKYIKPSIVLYRDNKERMFFGDSKIICKYLGHDVALNSKLTRLIDFDAYLISEIGDQLSIKLGHKGKVYEEINCGILSNMIDSFEYDQVVENKDGSVSFVNPRLNLGSQKLPVVAKYNRVKNLCYHLGGYSRSLDAEAQYSDNFSDSVAEIELRGRFNGYPSVPQLVRSTYLKEVTCLDYKPKEPVFKFEDRVLNSDGSETFFMPSVLGGKNYYYLYKDYRIEHSNADDFCNLNGYAYSDYNKLEYSRQAIPNVADLGFGNYFDGIKLISFERFMTKITCSNVEQ